LINSSSHSVIETMCQRPVNDDFSFTFDFAICQVATESLPMLNVIRQVSSSIQPVVLIEKRAPFLSVRGAPCEGFSFLRIFPLRISKTVSFTVYFDPGTALGFLAVRCRPCSLGHGALLCA
jgi:hypothetical protein